jgi:tRNA N6-adenosine threonylcarbamoyltransferase
MNKVTSPPGCRRLVLGIETSCDETAAAVVACGADGRGEILSNCVRSQIEEHRVFGGVVPEIAARAHVDCLDALIAAAMREADVAFSQLDGVAATAGPGLNSGLIVGVVTAKTLALAKHKPFLAINHLEAHALTVGLTDDLPPPYLLLLVSGGHTQLLYVRGVADYVRLGTTIDDALGEAFDKTAKLLGLGYPGGPEVARWAEKGDDKRFDFPRPMAGRKEPHFSFAGLKTAVRQQALALQPLDDQTVSDICASFERAVCETVADRVAGAMERCDRDFGQSMPRDLVVAGGVAANQRLRGAVLGLCAERDYTLTIPPVALCTDNAAMVAWAGLQRLQAGLTEPLDFKARPRWPLDPDAPAAIGAGVKA